MSIREPRNFLYDDYMDNDMGGRGSSSYCRSDFGIGSSSRGLSVRGLDVGLDDYSRGRRPATDGLLRRHREELLDDFSGSQGQARRFADAMNIAPTRAQRVYDDLEYDAPLPRGRLQQLVYREAPRRRPVIRQVVGGRGFMNSPREVVQIVERVSRPQRRIHVVRKVPIQQRVVKKIIVKKVGGRPGRRSVGENKTRQQNSRVQGRKGGAIQKKKMTTTRGPNKDSKPKMSATDLDRELDEYMKSSKHPRIAA